MAVTTTQTNKPFNPRGNDQSPLAYNRAKLFSGKALSFDGVNDKITTSLNTTIFTDSGTISGYLKLDGLGGVKAGFGFRLSNQSEFYFLFVNNNSEFRLRTTDGITDVVADLTEFVGRWTLFTCTFGGGVMSLYADTTLLASENYTGDFRVNASSYYVFGESGGNAFWYDGEASNAKVFNTALTAAQVADLYNNPEKVVPTGVDNTALKLFLPMQEGAGTTAYDGSGNGNHGTISGATYTHGIGAPVSQTAVIDWNKGVNLLKYSEQIDNAVYVKAGGAGNSVVVTENYGTAPDGTQTADRVQITRGSTYAELFQRTTTSMVAGEDYVLSFYAKSLSGTPTLYTAWNDDYVNEVTFTTDWVRYEYQYQYITHIQGSGLNLVTWTNLPTTSTSADLLVWGVQLEKASSLGAYIPNHTNAAITSPVLLPQGLTTGRDITGVNLFENVRKQGALNLDGNSWAEVHDNGSLDLTNLSLECWFDNTNAYDSIRYLFDKSAGSVSGFELRLVSQNSVQLVFRNLSTISKVATIPISGWVHVVGIYDGSDIIVYVDGTLAGSVASSGSIGTNDDALSIGGDNTFAPYRLNKPIAQPRIYNRALTAEEVQRNYNAGKNTYTN